MLLLAGPRAERQAVIVVFYRISTVCSIVEPLLCFVLGKQGWTDHRRANG